MVRTQLSIATLTALALGTNLKFNLGTNRTARDKKSYRVVKVDEIFKVVRPGRPWHANQIFSYIAGP